MKFPPMSAELTNELDRMFPEKVPEAGDSMEDIQRYAGKRELVIFIKHWRDSIQRKADAPPPQRRR